MIPDTVFCNLFISLSLSRTSKTESVWVTALALRALHEISKTWTHLVYVDPQVTDKALRFILGHQGGHGAWWEPGGSVGDRNLLPAQYWLSADSTHSLNLSLSAHTVLSLAALHDLPSPLDAAVDAAVRRGARWLEENLNVVGEVSRALEVSVVALALHVAESPLARMAFDILTRNAHQESKDVC